MKRRKRKTFQSSEQERRWLEKREARRRLLQERIALAQAELATTGGKRPLDQEVALPPDQKRWTRQDWRAWRARRDARLRDLLGHIRRIEAELAAKKEQA